MSNLSLLYPLLLTFRTLFVVFAHFCLSLSLFTAVYNLDWVRLRCLLLFDSEFNDHGYRQVLFHRLPHHLPQQTHPPQTVHSHCHCVVLFNHLHASHFMLGLMVPPERRRWPYRRHEPGVHHWGIHQSVTSGG